MSASPPQVNNKKEDNNANPRRLLLASAQVAASTFLSRVFGLARDMTIAIQFGASPATDAFFIAFKIPNFFRRMFAEGSLTQGFVPVLNEYRQQGSTEEIKALIASVSGALGVFLFFFVALGMLFAYWIVLAISPGFYDQPEQLALATDMLRLTFPYLLLISLTALAAGVLNTYQSFALPALTPIWLNICMITAAFVLAPQLAQPIHALAWGVLIAGVVQLLFLLPPLQQRQLLVLPRLQLKHSGVRKVVKLMLPTMFGASITQINLLIDLLLASFLMSGSISWLYYSDRLLELPLGIFGIGVATVILPALSLHSSAIDRQAFQQTLDWAIRMILLIGAPASVALVLLSEAVLTTLFQYGSTTPFDVHMAALSLNMYATGLIAFMLVKVLAIGFFAEQNAKTPVKIGLIAVAVNTLLNFALIGWLAHAGLALASSLAAILNAGLLFRALLQRKSFWLSPGWFSFLLRLVLALLAMGCVLVYICPITDAWLAMHFSERAVRLAGICLLGALTYVGALMMFGFRPRSMMRV